MGWCKIDKTTGPDGLPIITYELEGSKKWVLVQSRRVRIPHAPGNHYGGYWETARYRIILRGITDPREFVRLSDAQKEAERLGKKFGYLGDPPEEDAEDEYMNLRIREVYNGLQ